MKRLVLIPVSLLFVGCASVPEQDKIAATEKCDILFSDIEKQSCLQTLHATDDYMKFSAAQKLSEAETARFEQRRRELVLGVPEKNAGGFKFERPKD